jgi:uncharacterized protein
MNENIIPAPSVESAESLSFMRKVFGWMTLGLAVTGVTAYVVASIPELTRFVYGNIGVFYILLILELCAVAFLASMVQRINSLQASLVFMLYSILNGITFSIIFLVYEMSSIGAVFFITAGMFAGLSLYGYFTKRDLTGLGTMAFMGLIGLILASIVNMFIMNDRAFLIMAYVGVVIFTILTAYDVQKIKQLNVIGNAGTDQDKKEAIMGALTLYLDFINLFLRLLRIFGKRRR